MRAYNKKRKPKHHSKASWNTWNTCLHARDMQAPKEVSDFGFEVMVHVVDFILVEVEQWKREKRGD